jgi:peptide-methionine (S)-S-oxide reductase
MTTESMKTEIALLGGGCFWCLEAVFRGVRGVLEVQSGYAGGHLKNPGYRDICRGTTGHAEVVRIEFDPEEVSYRRLLEIFFSSHDPTTLNRQGADIGTQYRSVIFHHDEEQRRTAREVMESISNSGVWEDELVTELRPAEPFWIAEPEHQHYFERNLTQGYCQVVVAPKVSRARSAFPDSFG